MRAYWLNPILFAVAVCAWLVATAYGASAGTQDGWPVALWALLLHIVFALSALATLLTSQAWRQAPASLRDGGFPSLRSLALLTPAVVLLQAGLGTAYHAGALGVVPHAAWAFVAGMLVMMQATFALTQNGAPALLRRLAVAQLVLVVAQVVLGVAALLMRTVGQTEASWTSLPLALHTAAGSLIIAFSGLLAALTLRHFEPAPQSELATPGRHS